MAMWKPGILASWFLSITIHRGRQTPQPKGHIFPDIYMATRHITRILMRDIHRQTSDINIWKTIRSIQPDPD